MSLLGDITSTIAINSTLWSLRDWIQAHPGEDIVAEIDRRLKQEGRPS